jgi:putative PEP-CTERM system histidine kinase
LLLKERPDLVNTTTLSTVAAWSYGLAVIGYLAFAIRMLFGWRGGLRASLLFASALATMLWAASNLVAVVWPSATAWLASDVTDTLRYTVWFVFLANLLQAKPEPVDLTEAKRPVRPRALELVALGLLASLALSDALPFSRAFGLETQRAAFGVRLGLAVFALVLIEQLIRRTQPQERWAIKPLCVALAGIFAFDLFLYADAMLFARIDGDLWVARGIANGLVIPFLAVATARNSGWTVEMHLSREAAFHSTALVLSGVFLFATAAAGYYIRYFGGDWGRVLEIELLFGALLCIVVVASSGRFRSKLRVFVSKHFFSYRYDYREEWLRFTRTLSTEGAFLGVHERVIMALANLVESPAGMLWLQTEERGIQMAARWNLPAVDEVEKDDSSLARFLDTTGWVIDVTEYAAAPDRYPGLVLPQWLASIKEPWLIVPLGSGTGLIGFIVLSMPRTKVEVDWEVRDMLKSASQQAASYLGQIRATEALLEVRKFDAFNRMSAFVVHDLKNLVAQLSLMLRNAERHRNNPEFQRDMLSTVENVVDKMHKLMLQLRTGATPLENLRLIDLAVIVRRVCASKSSHEPPIHVAVTAPVVAFGHEDRLEHVIGHLLQNAIDATVGGGGVSVRLYGEDGFAVIEVSDTGIGMSSEFVRERLFKPFQTTKKAGMGIGVYESVQYISGLGGKILVDSTVKVGTRVRVLLPLGDSATAPSAPLKEVA